VGSSIGHAIGGFFGGGSSQAVEQPQDNNAVAAQGQNNQSSYGARNCDVDARQFTQCMDEHQGNMQICNWYLEQLVCRFTRLYAPEECSDFNVFTESLPASCQAVLGSQNCIRRRYSIRH
jgi:hypothetical protein